MKVQDRFRKLTIVNGGGRFSKGRLNSKVLSPKVLFRDRKREVQYLGDNISMLRDRNLVPLSHHHQHALALCVRIGKAFAEVHDTPDVHRWEAEIVQLFDQEISYHFLAEEKVLFPAASKWDELQQLVDELLIEHTLLRRNVERARARQFTVTDLQVFTATLSEHVRKEERQLFESMQRLLTAEEITDVGYRLGDYFRHSGMAAESCPISRPSSLSS